MTRLVVHAGPPGTGWPAMQRQLVSWRDPLSVAGVRLHPADAAKSWLSGTDDVANDVAPRELVVSAQAAVRDGARMLLLSSEKLADGLRDADQVANLVAFAKEHEMPLTVVVVLRDQLGCLNELYCDRVVHLQMARSFPSFAADPSPAERFDYSKAFNLLIEHPDIELVAVPYGDLRPGVEAKSVLTAAGLDAEEVADLPRDDSPFRLPGPFHVAAARLMFKRFWRLGISTKVARSKISGAAAALERHAVTRGWDDAPYWGWDRASREAAVARYHEGNDELARVVWGREWGDAWEAHDFVDLDLASSDPLLLVDVLTTVDTLVKDLQGLEEPVHDA